MHIEPFDSKYTFILIYEPSTVTLLYFENNEKLLRTFYTSFYMHVRVRVRVCYVSIRPHFQRQVKNFDNSFNTRCKVCIVRNSFFNYIDKSVARSVVKCDAVVEMTKRNGYC